MLTTCSLAIFLYKHAEAFQNTPHRSGNVEKSDENQETQSTGIAKNPLNFEYALLSVLTPLSGWRKPNFHHYTGL